MKYLRSYGWCAFIFCLAVLQMHSQNIPVSHRFALNADYCRFWQNDSTAFLEISTAVYPHLAVLKHDSLGYRGNVDLVILIQNNSSGAFVHTDRFAIPIHLVDSASLAPTKSIVNNATYALGYGSYRVTVYGYDTSDRLRRDSSSFSVAITKRPAAAALSDIELCSQISESSDPKDVFYKNTYRVIPNPSCVFGSTTSPVVFTYTEMYNLIVGMTYSIKAQVVDLKGDVKKYRTHLRRFSEPNIVDVTTLNVTSMNSGKYNYEVILSDSVGHEIARSRRPIFLYNPDVQPAPATALSGRSAEFAGLSFDELAEEFRTARYIARSEDTELFDMLKTLEARREFLGKFWAGIENQESGRSGLTRTIYLQRVQTANLRYRTHAKEGWGTDRGRVYVLYGEPDETQRFPNSEDSRPYEIWNYHAIEGGVEFIFIDLTGFNEYILVHSTKRGEIQDESWEQFLHTLRPTSIEN